VELWRDRLREPGWLLLPLRTFLAIVFLDAGISKVADRRYFDAASPRSIHASVLAIRHTSPIGSLLGPVQSHSWGFGLVMAFAELAVGIGLALGLFTRLAAAGGMVVALSLWLTISWGAVPWFTSADVVYLFALTPFVLVGAPVLSADAWLEQMRVAHPGVYEDRTRRTLLFGGASLLGGMLLGAATIARRSPSTPAARSADTAAAPAPLVAAAQVPVGGAKQVTDAATGDPVWVLQLQSGQFTAYDAICPHQGCTVEFVSAADGFACPCHGSAFTPTGALINGPAPHGLTPVHVSVQNGQVRTT
jgi:thiosulfate dehydrogenase [quinone] large subunit